MHPKAIMISVVYKNHLKWRRLCFQMDSPINFTANDLWNVRVTSYDSDATRIGNSATYQLIFAPLYELLIEMAFRIPLSLTFTNFQKTEGQRQPNGSFNGMMGLIETNVCFGILYIFLFTNSEIVCKIN